MSGEEEQAKERAREKTPTSNHYFRRRRNSFSLIHSALALTLPTMRAAATATAVVAATKSISRTESLQLVRCLLRVVSWCFFLWWVRKRKNKREVNRESERGECSFSSSRELPCGSIPRFVAELTRRATSQRTAREQ